MILVYLGNVGSSGCHRPIPTFTQNSAQLVTGAYPFRGGSTVLWQSNLSSWRLFCLPPFWALWPPWVVGRWDKSSGISIQHHTRYHSTEGSESAGSAGTWILGGCEPPSCYDSRAMFASFPFTVLDPISFRSFFPSKPGGQRFEMQGACV